MDAHRPPSKKPSDTSEKPQHETLTFFVDRCLGRSVVERLRGAGFRVEHKDDHFEPTTDDATWLTEVGKSGWVVLTRDTRIRRRRDERNAVMTAGLRFFSLQTKRGEGGRRGLTGEDIAQLLLDNMQKITRLALEHPPPFIAAITRSGVTIIDKST